MHLKLRDDPEKFERDTPNATPASNGYTISRLRDAGVRVTAARVMILRFFLDVQRGHHSAEDVYREIARRGRTVHLSSVYRALSQLRSADLLSAVMLDSTRVVYELNAGPTHDHLVCTRCCSVFDFSDPTLDARRQAVADHHRFQVERHQLIMHGVCYGCRTS